MEDFFNSAVKCIKTHNVEKLKKLLEENPSVLEMHDDYNDNSLLHIATDAHSSEIVELLLKNNADPNVLDFLGWTPLILASVYGYIDIIQILLKYGADLNHTDVYNQTPLHVAVSDNKIDVAKYLILRGADISVKNYYNKSPLDYIEDTRLKNELLFVYKNKDTILKKHNGVL